MEQVFQGTSGPDPATTLERKSEWERVNRVLSTLPDRQGEAARLRLLEGLPYRAVAARLEIKVSSARRLVHRAKKSLRRRYSGAKSA